MTSAKVLWRLIQPHKGLLLLIVATGALGAAAEGAAMLLVVPLVSALGGADVFSEVPVRFVSEYFAGLSVKSLALAVGIALPLAWTLRSFLQYSNALLAIRLGYKVDGEWKARTHGKILHMEFGAFTRDTRGNLLTMMEFNCFTAGKFAQISTQQIATFSLMGAYLTGLLLLSWQLALIGLGVALVQSQALIPLHAWARRSATSQRESMSTLNTGTVETLDGQREIRVFDQEETVHSKYLQAIRGYVSTSFRVQGINALASPAFTSLTMVSVGVLIISSSLFLSHLGESWIAVLMIFLLFAYRLNGSFGQLSQAQTTLSGALVVVDSLLEFVDGQSGETARDGTVHVKSINTGIEFRNVSFKYDPEEPEVLKNVSFTIPRGRITAIVGSSGAGKSTLSNLLVRLHSPQGGSILVDGIDSRELDIHSWRSRVGVISQETFLFNDTVFNNIAFGRPEASLKDVKEAAQRAEAAAFIDSLPKGYDTELGDRGVRLSGGQRQRIALSRVLHIKPDLLILDEATSSLDAETEAAIMESIHGLRGDHTIVVIAHRWSTIRGADNIVVLDHGEKVEEGTHETLISRRGRYYSLVQTQISDASVPAEKGPPV